MQGVVFTVLSDCVIDNFGLPLWNEVLEDVAPESGGIYTSSRTYSDDELFSLVGKVAEKTQTPVKDLIKVFGTYMFPHLLNHMPEAVQPGMSLKDFLLSIDQVIHTEVKKMHPGAYLPSIDYEDSCDKTLVMMYTSKRKLCILAEGLITGAAAHFGDDISIAHPECMHDGHEACRLEVSMH